MLIVSVSACQSGLYVTQGTDQSVSTSTETNTNTTTTNQDQDYLESLAHVVARFYRYLDRAVDFVKA